MMTKRDITRLARKLLPPGVRIVAMATAPPARLRFRLKMAPGVDPLKAQAALHALLERATAGSGFTPGRRAGGSSIRPTSRSCRRSKVATTRR